jgi:DNA-binding transcriptional MocR family regulator
MDTIIQPASDLLYLRIARNLEQQILHEVLRVGDKLPSLRVLCSEHGVSQSTALQAYYYLESKSLIESRPQSGYYVCYSPGKFPAIPATSKPHDSKNNSQIEEIIAKVYNNMGSATSTILSLGVPAEELLPIAKLNKGMVQALRELKGSGTAYDQIQGNEKLRRQIARWSLPMEGKLNEHDLVTTAGCMNALSFCMMSLTERGETIAVESPVYFGILQLAQNLGLKVLELPTHPQTGIEIDALKNALAKRKISLCVLVSNFSNPLGSCMPDEHKQEVVKLLEKHNVPLIEDDLYGDVYFGSHRPKSCKTYDESGMVLWCSSVSKTLAPGYRVGWVAPGKFKAKIIRTKLYHSISAPAITQQVIANFLESGRYENHLRKMRTTLHANCLQYIRAICNYFPDDTRVSRPQGGFVLLGRAQ